MQPPKRVVIVYDFAYVNGGQARVAIDTAKLLATRGIKVSYFAACGPVSRELIHPDIEVICLEQNDILNEPNRLAAVAGGIWNIKARRALREAVSSFDPNDTVLHCHGYAKALSPSIGPILTGGPLKSVYTMHEYFLACPNGAFYDFQKNEICGRQALGPSCLTTNCDVRSGAHKGWRVARQIATWKIAAIPKLLTDVIYISETQRKAMATYLDPRTRLHYLPNPVTSPDTPIFDPTGNDIFLFVGRLSAEKGGTMFAEAAKRAGVRAVFVGDGHEADAIRAANPDAEMVGWQPAEAVEAWLARARALVFPSLWYECQPLVPLEALTRGIPVVCGGWSAASESVVSGKNGIVYAQPTVECLVDAMGSVRELPRFDTREMRERTSSQTYADNLLHLYSGMLDRTTAVVE